MAEEKEKKRKEKHANISRREFLKDAGLVVGGTSLGSIAVLSACANEKTITETATKTSTATVTTTIPAVTTTVTSPPVTVEVVKTYPASQGYLLVDSRVCAGCHACMMACSMVHDGKSSLSNSRIQVEQNLLAVFPEDFKINQCRQCVNPLCVQACPSGACHVDTEHGNTRVIDSAKCLGKTCMKCINACPFIPHRTVFNYEKNYSMKCDLCIDAPYWDEKSGIDGKQACVEVCPVHAIKFVAETPSQLGEAGYDLHLADPPQVTPQGVQNVGGDTGPTYDIS